MNKCPICDSEQAINDFGIITRKKTERADCRNDLILIEKPSSYFVDLSFVIIFLAIYAPLRASGYGRWISLPLLLICSFVFPFLKGRIPTNFTIMTPDSLRPIKRAEKINLLLLVGTVALGVSFVYFF